MVAALRPRLLVGSAAAGADLLVLSVGMELADEFDISLVVITAGRTDAFQRSSVADRGTQWISLYEEVLRHRRADIIELPVTPDDDGFMEVNRQTIETAQQRRTDGELIVGLRLGPRQNRPRAVMDHSAHFAEGLHRQHYPVFTVRTDLRRFPDAFVAMPFGDKEIPSRGWTAYAADASYDRIFVPALIAAGFQPRRVDNDNFIEIIDAAMIRPLGEAELVVGDLTTANPNVCWELGVRHAWRPWGTSLVCIEDAPIPFDLGRVPVHPYFRGEDQVSEADLVRSLESLVPAFGAHANDRRMLVDSPVFTHLPGLRPVDLPSLPDPAAYERVDDLDREVERACALRRPHDLVELSRTLAADPSVPTEQVPRLQGAIALALVELNQLDEARALLAPLARADRAGQNRVLQQRYAHTLIRGESGDRDQNLTEARYVLRSLQRRHVDPETSGLLGSAEKVMAERALARDDSDAARAHARAAAEAYEEGFRSDPRAYYPGVNALALYRLLGQRWEPNPEDLKRAHEILPVVRFVVGGVADASIWTRLTAAEVELHGYLLDEPDPAADPPTGLLRVFSRLRVQISEHQDGSSGLGSFSRQLRLMIAAGDPEPLIKQLLGRLES